MKKLVFLFISLCSMHIASFAEKTPEILNYDWGKAVFEEQASPQTDTIRASILKSITRMEFLYNDENNLDGYILSHEKVKINNNDGLESYNKIRFGLNSTNEMLVLKARFIGKDGKIIELDKSDLRTVEREDGRGSYLLLAIEGAESGGIIEYYWIRKGIRNLYGNYTIQEELPKKAVEFSIISPLNLGFIAKSYNGCPEMTEKIDSVKQQRTFSLFASNVPALKEEKHSYYQRHLQQVEYTLGYNYSKGKRRVYTWGQAIQNMFENTASFDEKELKSLQPVWKNIKIKDKMKDEEKIRLIENDIKTNFQLVEENVQDLSDFPNIISSKYTNKRGYIRMLSATFEHFNIPYELVVTCDKTERLFDKDFDAYNFLDDFLFYFPDIDKYLDPNDMFTRLGVIDVNYMENYGLFLKKVSASGISSFMPRVQWIPANDYKESVHTTNAQMKIDVKDFSASYACQNIFGGYTAQFIQPYLYHGAKDVQQHFIEQVLNNSSDKLGYWKINNQQPIDWYVKPVTVTTQFTGNSLISRGGNDIIVKIGELIGKQEEMYQQTERKLPIETDNTRSYVREITFEIPEGYEVSNPEILKMKKELTINGNPEAFFYSDYTITGNQLVVTSTETYKRTCFPVELYKEYITVINAAADFNKAALVLKKK